jgi:hypothetical protein
LDPQLQKSFEFASDSVKQLITLATGVTALTVTFAKDVQGSTAGSPHGTLTAAWVFYLISIVCGAWAQLALTGEIATINRTPELFRSNVVFPATLQVAAFLVATVLIIMTAVLH